MWLNLMVIWILLQTRFVQLVVLWLFQIIPSLACIIQTAVFVRIFIIFHDCVHSTFFETSTQNKWAGIILSGIIRTPLAFWKKNHLFHHRNFGNLDTVDEADTIIFTKQQFERFPFVKRMAWKFIRYPPIFFLLVPIFQWGIQYPFINPIFIPLHLLHLWIASKISYINMLSFYLAAMFGMMLFHLQHAVNSGYRATTANWTLVNSALFGSTYIPIPFPLSWATLGIEFHHIHHLSTRVPCYYLSKCHHEAVPDAWRGITVVTLDKLWDSIWNVMWDEEKEKFVPF